MVPGILTATSEAVKGRAIEGLLFLQLHPTQTS